MEEAKDLDLWAGIFADDLRDEGKEKAPKRYKKLKSGKQGCYTEYM